MRQTLPETITRRVPSHHLHHGSLSIDIENRTEWLPASMQWAFGRFVLIEIPPAHIKRPSYMHV